LAFWVWLDRGKANLRRELRFLGMGGALSCSKVALKCRHLPPLISLSDHPSKLSNPAACLIPIQRLRIHRKTSTRAFSTFSRTTDVFDSIVASVSVVWGRNKMEETRVWDLVKFEEGRGNECHH